jgi:hypothetical protein
MGIVHHTTLGQAQKFALNSITGCNRKYHVQYGVNETCVGLKIWWGAIAVSARLRPPAEFFRHIFDQPVSAGDPGGRRFQWTPAHIQEYLLSPIHQQETQCQAHVLSITRFEM